MTKVVTVVRHKLLPSQEEALRKANFEVLRNVEQIPNPGTQEFNQLIQQLKAEGVKGIVTVALPPHLLQALSQHFEVFILKMEAIKTTENQAEAEKLVNEKPTHRVALKGALGEKETFRILEFKGIFKIKVQIIEEPVVTV